MAERQLEIAEFIQSAGWQDATRSPLAGDASPRRYERLARDGTPPSAVLMDAPREKGEDIRPFLSIARFLSDCRYSAPEIFAADEATGLVLLEDLGDDLFARVCKSDPTREQQLYEAAVDVLSNLRTQPPPAGLQPYSDHVYRRESNLLPEWYLPAATGQPTDPGLQDSFTGLVSSACSKITNDHSCCVLRDYHAENLLWLPSRDGLCRVGLLDFQDALLGHPAYDLVSLLEDARRDTSASFRANMLERYLDGYDGDPTAFRYAYAALGAQRNLKIIGIFTRLCVRDGKEGYVDMIPRVWNHLMNDLKHPSLAELRAFVERFVPAPAGSVLDRIRAIA